MQFLKELYYKKYSKRSYSFNNVDLIIDYLFKDIKNGIYIDVGCNHPIKYNNTYLLYKRGWSGINIDLDASSIKLFDEYRKGDHNIGALVSNEEKIKKTYIYHERSTINTVEKTMVDLKINKPKKIIERQSITLNKIIQNSPFSEKKINLLTVDVEGHEFPVLENFEFSKYGIDVVVLELLNDKVDKMEMHKQSLELVMKSNIYNLLLKRGYKLINWIHSDLIFVNNNFNKGKKNE